MQNLKRHVQSVQSTCLSQLCKFVTFLSPSLLWLVSRPYKRCGYKFEKQTLSVCISCGAPQCLRYIHITGDEVSFTTGQSSGY